MRKISHTAGAPLSHHVHAGYYPASTEIYKHRSKFRLSWHKLESASRRWPVPFCGIQDIPCEQSVWSKANVLSINGPVNEVFAIFCQSVWS
ncbi:MAG: hypothetical protein IPH84_04470 [Bacteroidales bacterium]|nr:hypothetical protein [Bacteroidales bacterium]